MATSINSKFSHYLENKSRLVVLTGAGISAGSGIPTYRDREGNWQRSDPIQHQDFVRQQTARQRYWLRSFIGWPAVADAEPSASHFALAELERRGIVSLLVTQNVDRLHQKAGSAEVIDLHGRLDRVVCLDCGAYATRSNIQQELLELNPFLNSISKSVELAPDGDANVESSVMTKITTPGCHSCGGDLKPDVVFFGDNVDRSTVQAVYDAIDDADGLLIVGTSLKVFSGYRFCRYAAEREVDIASINPGVTRGDELINTAIKADSDDILRHYVSGVDGGAGGISTA